MKTVNTKFPEDEVERMDKIVDEKGYPNRSEFIREAVRDKLDKEMKIDPKVIERVIRGREEDLDEMESLKERGNSKGEEKESYGSQDQLKG